MPDTNQPHGQTSPSDSMHTSESGGESDSGHDALNSEENRLQAASEAVLDSTQPSKADEPLEPQESCVRNHPTEDTGENVPPGDQVTPTNQETDPCEGADAPEAVPTPVSAPVTASLLPIGIPSVVPPYMAPPNATLQAIIAAQQQSWNAPYPPPEAAERFEAICPGAFNRMLVMAEKGQANQIDISQKQIKIAENQIVLAERGQDFLARDTRRGHWLGAAISGLAMLGSAVCGLADHTAVAIAFLGLPVTTVAIALINSRTSGKSNDSRGETQKKASNEKVEAPHAPPKNTN